MFVVEVYRGSKKCCRVVGCFLHHLFLCACHVDLVSVVLFVCTEIHQFVILLNTEAVVHAL